MDIDTYIRFTLALVFVIALFVVLALVLRRLGYGGTIHTPARQRRLSIVEVLPLDTRRRLVLVRRDDSEHLLLLSTTGDRVVESPVRSGFRDALAAADRPRGGEGGTP
ncbi:flagellar biosynthetic protein FliO [Azospirillum halopraeferens]|uniref:flagellar biosynthetic protein FliO n=1 Tax=Azospirillum halopraeferens TaxID=34010 RepID=UPI0003FA8A24|nr:flagellar biosynthetic protein FliO [Azospirillum halopraeferens]